MNPAALLNRMSIDPAQRNAERLTADSMTEQERELCVQLNIRPSEFLKTRAKERAERRGL